MNKAKALKKGDTIIFISPASKPADETRIPRAAKYFEDKGFKVEIAANVGKETGYLAGTDKERSSDINKAFRNKNISAIFCLRGGYGTPRILTQLDYKQIKNAPKIFCGYSDITALQSAFMSQSKLISFAGPMPAVDFHGEIDPVTEASFFRVLTGGEKNMNLMADYQGGDVQFIGKGEIEGRLIGGNLALLTALCGSPYLPDFKDKILLLEDVGEKPYRIDRMLNQLEISGGLAKLRGIILGQFTDCAEDEGKPTLTIEEILKRYIYKLKIPVVSNFPHGHVKTNLTMPIGAAIKINFKKKLISAAEKVVL